MAVDLSMNKGRQPGTRRSGGRGPRDPSGPTERTRATQRMVSVSNSLNDFFQAAKPGIDRGIALFGQANEMAEDRAANKYIEEVSRENALKIDEFRREAQVNRAALKEARETGDYSKTNIKGMDGFKDRRVVMDNLSRILAQQGAEEDKVALEENLRGISDPSELDQAANEYLEAQLKGSTDEIYNSEYTRQITAFSASMIETRRTEIRNASIVKARQTSRQDSVKNLLDATRTWHLTDIDNEVIDNITATLIQGGATPENAALEAPEIADQALLAAAAERPELNSLILEKSELRGTSAEERNPGQFAQLLRQQTVAANQLMTKEAINSISEVGQAIGRWGTQYQTMDAGQIESALSNFRQKYGDNSTEYKNAEAAWLKLQGADAKKTAVRNSILSGVMPSATDQDMAAGVESVWRDWDNLTPEEQTNAASVLANDGISGDAREMIQRDLRTPSRADSARMKIAAIKNANPTARYEDFLDDRYAQDMRALEWFEEAGIEKGAVLKSLDERGEKVDPFQYYDKTLLEKSAAGQSEGVAAGARGSRRLASEIDGYDEADDLLKREYRKSINLAAFHLRNTEGVDDDQIKSLAEKLLEGRVSYEGDGDGDLRQTIDRTPFGATAPDEAAVARITARGQAKFTDEGPLGEYAGFRQDSGYAEGRGFLMQLEDANGNVGDATLRPNEVVAIPRELLPDWMAGILEEQPGSTDELYLGKVRSGAMGDTHDMGDGVKYAWNEKYGSWEIRLQDVPPVQGPPTIQDIEGGFELSEDDPETTVDQPFEIKKKPRLEQKGPRSVRPSFSKRSGAPAGAPPQRLERKQTNAGPVWRRKGMAAVDRAVDRGEVLAEDARVAKEEIASSDTYNIEDILKRAIERTHDKTGGIVNNASGYNLMSAAGDFISREEGLRTTMYKDTKGIPTIGIGFNLNRDDAKEKIEAMGYDFSKVYAGTESITEADAKRLRDVVMQEEYNWLKGRLKKGGADISKLKGHQIEALLSLAYNGRVLIGPKLTAAIARGDWKAAEYEIRHNSNGNKSAKPSVRAAIDERRNREADKFMGVR